MKKLIARYQNGNYNVKLYSDGTKIRFGSDDVTFESAFPENIDIKITDYCDAGCAFCHENSTVEGKHGQILDAAFLNTLRPGTELAIGGGNPLSHPDLEAFLIQCRDRGIVSNLTVNAFHVDGHSIERLDSYLKRGLVHGIGISVNSFNAYVFAIARKYPNVVLHVINGVISDKVLRAYRDAKTKILILGYKMFRRGLTAHSPRTESRKNDLYNSLGDILQMFNTVSFDNLAIEQLEPQRFMTDQEWQTFYMGDDGKYTMYIDMVKKEFALNSTASIRYPLLTHIDDMFRVVKNQANEGDDHRELG